MLNLQIEKASLHILMAYDIGFEIKLTQIQDIFKDVLSPNKRISSAGIGRLALPIRVQGPMISLPLMNREWTFHVTMTFFDIGALSLEFISPSDLSFDEMPKAAAAIQSHPELFKAAEKMARAIFERAKSAVVSPEFLATPSTFMVFDIQKLQPRLPAQKIIEIAGPRIAQTLRFSDEAMGASEVVRAISPNVTYSDDDIVFASSNVAVIFDETSSEVIDLFELANMQSLELRFLDAKLDRHLQKLYDETEKSETWTYTFKSLFESNTRKLNTIHLDTTIVAERVEQGFKFAADSYLVRIHELAVEKMFLSTLSRGINRKLDAIRDIFRDQRDRASSLRMEILEWIIIALIAFEVIPVIWAKFHG